MTELALCIRFMVAGIFLVAGGLKYRSRASLADAIGRYQVLPTAAVGPMAAALVPLELLLGGFLLVGFLPATMLRILGVALVAFAVAMAVNLLRSRVIDCGCWGSDPNPISWGLVARNTLLGFAAWAAASAEPSALGIWVPHPTTPPVTATAAVACAVLTALALVALRLSIVLVRDWRTARPHWLVRGNSLIGHTA